MSKILHLIVNYKSDQETATLLNELKPLATNHEVQWLVINNSALNQKDTSILKDLDDPQKVLLVNCPDNPGYFGGAARAYQVVNPREYSYTILSNSDLEIVNKDFYQFLLDYKIANNTGAIAPSIKSELTKKESNPQYLRRPHFSKIQRLSYVYSNFALAWVYHLLSWLKNRFLDSSSSIQENNEMYALNGSFIVLHKIFFEKGGSFAYPVKLYGEEIFLAEQLRKLNLKTVFLPQLKIIHKEKGTEKSWFSRYAISYQTFLYKKEAAQFLLSLFKAN